MSNLLTYIQSQTKPRYTDLQQTSLSQYIKTQTAKTPQQTTTQSSIPQKYGTVNGKTTLPSHIENQGLYDLNEKTKFDYFADSTAKSLVGGAIQFGQSLWQDLSGETGKARKAYDDYVMQSAYKPETAGKMGQYWEKVQTASKNTKLNTETTGYKMLDSAQKDMEKATEGMSEKGKFATGVASSVLQNAYIAPLAVLNPALAAGVMATSVAGQSVKQQADKGKTLKEANTRGVLDGLVEYLVGKIGMDATAELLLGKGGMFKNIAKNMLSEAGEETASYLANYSIDRLSGDNVQFDLKELGLNALSGALAGGISGTGSAAIGKLANNPLSAYTTPAESDRMYDAYSKVVNDNFAKYFKDSVDSQNLNSIKLDISAETDYTEGDSAEKETLAYGAYTDKNDPFGEKREKSAIDYFDQILKRDRRYEINAVAKNTAYSEDDIEKVFSHIFEIEHKFASGKIKRFDPDYYMQQSWMRLREGKNIKKHDIIMLKHELLEAEIMNNNPNITYEEAHAMAEKVYDYNKELSEYLKNNYA